MCHYLIPFRIKGLPDITDQIVVFLVKEVLRILNHVILFSHFFLIGKLLEDQHPTALCLSFNTKFHELPLTNTGSIAMVGGNIHIKASAKQIPNESHKLIRVGQILYIPIHSGSSLLLTVHHVVYIIDDDTAAPNHQSKVRIVSSVIFDLVFAKAKAHRVIGEFFPFLACTPWTWKLHRVLARNKTLSRKRSNCRNHGKRCRAFVVYAMEAP